MSDVTIVVKPRDLKKLLNANLKNIARAGQRAGVKTASQAVRVIRKNAPHAFGQLHLSAHAEERVTGAATVIDAPHAAAVERGARPHYVPLEDLIAWVKLRGMQGLKPGRKRGSTTAMHARSIRAELKSMERDGALAVDAPEQIARRIQYWIAQNGIKPQWYALRSLPEIGRLLHGNLQKALRDPRVSAFNRA